MKPQTAAFLEKAHAFLDKAQGLLDAHHWPDEAGRAAYLAGLHAAQAFIFESTGKVIKRHSGVQREFARLMKDEPRFDMELRAFLPRTGLSSVSLLLFHPTVLDSRPRGKQALGGPLRKKPTLLSRLYHLCYRQIPLPLLTVPD